MTGEQRRALKEALDARRRAAEAVQVDDCGDAASPWRYNNHNCRCKSCTRAASEYRQILRQRENVETRRAKDRVYRAKWRARRREKPA